MRPQTVNRLEIDLGLRDGRRGDVPYSLSGAAPRKEVIQPHVPVRLPCYDFTPITDPTLGACLPCGLARRV